VEWRLEVRQAAFVQTDSHYTDLERMHESFAEWLGSARLELLGGRVWAYAATEEEAHRFEDAARAVIAEQDLYLVTSIQQRPDGARRWKNVDRVEPVASDDEIEAELSPFLED
jgi:hypothetical protein